MDNGCLAQEFKPDALSIIFSDHAESRSRNGAVFLWAQSIQKKRLNLIISIFVIWIK